jgi:uncharacterized repeat protein (TIGR01451 family)
VSFLTAGLLGVYWVATAQDGRTPWPPPPVKLDEVGSSLSPLPPLTPPIQPQSGKSPVPADSKSAAEKKPGPVRKWLSGILPAAGPEAAKAKPGHGGIQQAGYHDGGQDIPPPIPPKLTVPPATPPTMPPAVESEPRLAPMAPPLALPLDLPPIPMPALPSNTGAPPTMPVADPPRADPIKSVITEPIQQVPVPEPGPAKSAGPGIAKTMPALESTQTGAAAADTLSKGTPSNAGPSGTGKPPAFVIINPRKSDGASGSLVSAPALPTAAATGQGTGLPLPDPLPPQPKPGVGSVSKSSQPGDSGTTLLGVQTPHLTVEKRGSVVSRPGEPSSFQILVRNLGPVTANQVRVEDDLPGDAKVLSADPAPQLQGNRAMWLLNAIPSGGSAVLSFSLQLGASGSLSHSTSVTVLGTGTVTTAASPPKASPSSIASAALAVKVAAPAGVAVGRPVVFEVTYANQSNQRMTGLVLHALLSPGLRHPIGQSIEADVGDLEPGSSKTVKVEAGAVLAGPQGMQVRIARTGGPEASAQAVLDVVSAVTGVGVQQAPATRLFLGKTSDLKLEITNHTGKPIRHVAVVSYLPENVDYVVASDRGNYQPNGRTVNWLVDTLAAGQTQVLQVRVQGKIAGQLAHQVIARADGVSESKSSAMLAVEGTADLAIALQGENALEVGKEAVYEVRIGNPGSGPNTNVRVEMTFAPGILPRNGTGPSPFRVDGQTVVFDNLSVLVAQGQAVYRVAAVGQSPGDRRVRVSVTSDQVRTPATRENSTRVYRD